MIAIVDVTLGATTVGLFDEVVGVVGDTVSLDHRLADGEVSPLEWLRAIDEASTRLGRPVVRAVCVAGFTSGLVTVDAAGHPVRNVWDDDRSEPDAGWCRKKLPLEWWESEVGIAPEARHAVTKMSWLHRSEVDAWARISSFVLPGDFVASRLAGLGSFVTTVSNTAAYGMFRASGTEPHPQVTELIDRERDWAHALPVVVPETRPIGRWNGADVFAGVDRTRFDELSPKTSLVGEIAAYFSSFLR
ncbi:MAG: FGGY family carbohydrate kinase [Ilumatobacteraceae bacterium]